MVFHIRVPRRFSAAAISAKIGETLRRPSIGLGTSKLPRAVSASTSNLSKRKKKFPTLHSEMYREFLAEFLATFMLCVIGNGAVLMNILDNGIARSFVNSFSYGVGVMVGAAVSINISGAHMNPAVTLAEAVMGRFPWRKVLPYMAGQYWGAFLSAAVLYECYWEGINAFDGGVRSAYGEATSTAKGFATFPADHVTIYGAFTDQVIGTGILLVGVMAITDRRGLNVPKQQIPLFLAFLITGLCIGFGLNCGAIFNPARDLGPRLFTVVAGYGWKVFAPLGGNYWWVAGVLAPHLGAILGMWVYMGFVGLHPTALEVEESESGSKSSSNYELTTKSSEYSPKYDLGESGSSPGTSDRAFLYQKVNTANHQTRITMERSDSTPNMQAGTAAGGGGGGALPRPESRHQLSRQFSIASHASQCDCTLCNNLNDSFNGTHTNSQTAKTYKV